ncbi:putative RNA polymerase ECF-type sigma factor [Nitratireductor aquibiodomus RA22]|uniref:Putative RNA polymerase ECF-type sigma factor n=1 Tax=Nitratireductor aquibiodomus RA22 TaxID=1189611 RepID=I5C8R3_9HYPH|nr:sigma-70 family RNA polymerase sigma factor [Nitratireductor aquibiodomus]EIM78215.1 putative RNA polymerase ECF-type sigma factor [Nitratireductor aquibiodomus RA22]
MKQNSKSAAKDDLARLIARVGSSRDIEAFERIFRAYAPQVRAFMLQRVRDPQLSEELMQETMVTVWRKAAQFDPSRGTPSAWIFTIARNLRIDNYRRSRRPDFDPNDPAFVPEPEPAADHALETRDEETRLHAAMTGLPSEQRDLLKLAFFEDVSHSEIADRLGLPLGTVKSRIRLAFSKLRAALGDRP